MIHFLLLNRKKSRWLYHSQELIDFLESRFGLQSESIFEDDDKLMGAEGSREQRALEGHFLDHL